MLMQYMYMFCNEQSIKYMKYMSICSMETSLSAGTMKVCGICTSGTPQTHWKLTGDESGLSTCTWPSAVCLTGVASCITCSAPERVLFSVSS